jgi:hypothetical protein
VTLAEVAAQQRRTRYDFVKDGLGVTTGDNVAQAVILAFESDPDFKLREKIEALAHEWEVAGELTREMPALRLRAILEGK